MLKTQKWRASFIRMNCVINFLRHYSTDILSKHYSVFFFRGTHGYMAPEVLQKGIAYDSSADWFSFGCMLYKLLKGYV